jgi:D-alanyl-D-alanine carboxypeptidase
MKKKLCSIFLIAVLLTGCSNKDVLLSYSSNVGETMYTADNLDSTTTGDLFAKDLCVVPVDEKIKKDGNLTASSTLIFDITDNKMLYENNIYQRLYPASITKIMTALVTLKHANLTDMVTISHNASHVSEPGARLCGFKENDKIELQTLLTSFLVYSGNDAGVAIAEHVAGSVPAFAKMMNEEAKELGAVDSHFVNPHGLHDDNHYTTAYDIYLIFNELTNYDTFLNIINRPSYTAKYTDKDGNPVEKTFASTDRFLNGKAAPPKGVKVLGGKTGTTDKAGSCLVLYSKGSNKHYYISIVLKADSGTDLFNQMGYLLKFINR